jgi:hypothetical protein
MINFPINACLSSCLAGLKHPLLIRKPWSARFMPIYGEILRIVREWMNGKERYVANNML